MGRIFFLGESFSAAYVPAQDVDRHLAAAAPESQVTTRGLVATQCSARIKRGRGKRIYCMKEKGQPS
jgi:hypothetical protein